MAKNLVAFVIPVFNDERNIRQCLKSIKKIEFPKEDYEIVVMDNGSTDGTHAILKELGVSFRVVPSVNVSALRNLGAFSAECQFLAFVDSDVSISPQWLKSGISCFEDPTVVACGCFPGIPPHSSWVQRAWDIHQRGRVKKGTLRPIAWLPSMNLLVDRKKFVDVGGFNENLVTAEDVDLCYRLGKGRTILLNPGMEAIHWGEARDLVTFWRKEVWRGLGNLGGMASHGLRWDELPSLIYPLYVVVFSCLAGIAFGIDAWNRAMKFSFFPSIFLCLPPTFLAIKTGLCSKRLSSVFPLFILYLLYGIARGFALIKTSFGIKR